MTSIILTLAQARDLQRMGAAQWPGPWGFLLPLPEPTLNKPLDHDTKSITALLMMEQGCSDAQIAMAVGAYGPGAKWMRGARSAYEASRPPQ